MAENDMTGLPDDEHDRLDAITQAIEKAICKASPCLDKAGVLTLIALRFGIPGLAMTPAGIEADTDIVDMDATMALSSLPCLLPYLSGSVARIAADFLAHPHRQVRYSLLFRSGVEA